MGDVMKESASIAYSYIQSIASDYGVKPDYFDSFTIHLHIPEGATPKDGPSAGAAMAGALLSLATGKQVRKNTAMTGELSLTGKVLPIGGLKEKVIAARRNGIKRVLIPETNLRDLDEIPDYIKKGIKFHTVSTMKDVIDLIL